MSSRSWIRPYFLEGLSPILIDTRAKLRECVETVLLEVGLSQAGEAMNRGLCINYATMMWLERIRCGLANEA